MIAMLLSCSNDIKEVDKYSSDNKSPGIYGKDLKMLYSDSLVIRYKITAKEYVEYTENDILVREFNNGMFAESFNNQSEFEASIKAQYARFNNTTGIWTIRYGVEVVSSSGDKLNTELMYWDQKNKIIYSDKYVRVTQNGQVIDCANGFKSDQNLDNIEFNEISGDIVI